MQDNNGMQVKDDEIVTPLDPQGELKISPLGELLNGREFRVKTFKVPTKGDRLYAISTDVARLIGYRDSYFLFQKHLNLFRVRINDSVKMSLINDGYLPYTFKTRQAYLITAKSAFKEFGARVIKNGKQVIDDYYEQFARDNGAIEGAYMNPLLSTDGHSSNLSLLNPNTNSPLNNLKDSNFDNNSNKSNLNNSIVNNSQILQTDLSWVYDHALKCRQFDNLMLYDRNEILKNNFQNDVYTNLNFVPSISQPTKSKISCLDSTTSANSNNSRCIDLIIGGSNSVFTGLSDIPPEIFTDCVDDEIKSAILSQQELELSL